MNVGRKEVRRKNKGRNVGGREGMTEKEERKTKEEGGKRNSFR